MPASALPDPGTPPSPTFPPTTPDSARTNAASDTATTESAPKPRPSNASAGSPMLFIERAINDAAHAGASDVHFEPQANRCQVRLRVDGRLQMHAEAPPAWRDMLATRLKVLAQLDIAEKRLPQDGRMVWREAGDPIECRVSALPTLHGEKLVVRLLDGAKVPLMLESLGYTPAQHKALLGAIARPHGLILLTGPTGSGKTVSLYSCLRRLNDEARNIVTIEDPVEIRLPGLTQVNVNERAGLTFATALRAFLRQDPDVLVVGEIRDAATATTAIQAAQTGHLVFATVHANDAPGTIARMLDLGVAPFNLSSTLLLVSAQRLVPRRCPAGCVPEMTRPTCMRCRGTGFAGRVGLFQVMPVSAALAARIAASRPPHELAAQAHSEGVMTLREAGMWHVQMGTVTQTDVDTHTVE